MGGHGPGRGAQGGHPIDAHPPRTVAQVCVDSALPHLDRPFDYEVPEALLGKVREGSRVRVPFAGRLVSGVVISLGEGSDFEGRLQQVKSSAAAPSFTPAALAFAREVARRYGGSLWDVLRLMAPPRVAAVEKRDQSEVEHDAEAYREAHTTLAQAAAAVGLPDTAASRGGRVVWQALPDPTRRHGLPIDALLAPVTAVASQDFSAIVILPDVRAIAAAADALTRAGLKRWTSRSGGHFAVVHAEEGPTVRYGAYLAAMHGHVRIVLGTRAAALQPVPRLGLLVLWEDGSPIYDEPHAPYPHARTVAAMRAEEEGAGLLLAGYAPTVEAMALVAHGWAERAPEDRALTRAATPLIDPLSDERREAEGGSGWHWMPGSAWRRLTAGLADGPVAILVPRAGYVRATACARCSTWAECPACGGPLRLDAPGSPLRCGECGAEHPDWHCPECHGNHPRQLRQGVERIAEQVRAMAPGVDVHLSAGAVGTLKDGEVERGIVVATPGALPAVTGGYSRIVIVGADTPAGGGLGAELHALRWWLSVAALARARGEGGEVLAVGELPPVVRQALTSWSGAEAAVEAYGERAELLLPPVRRTVRLWGAPPAIAFAMSARVEGERLERHPEVSAVPSAEGVTLLTSRRAAQPVVDALRLVAQELSRTGEGELRLRVDAPLDPRG